MKDYNVDDSTMLEKMRQILVLPVNAVVIVLLLPVFLACRLINGLTMLAEIPNILSSGEFMTAVEFVRSEKIAEHRRQSILGSKFPNSIAVRS